MQDATEKSQQVDVDRFLEDIKIVVRDGQELVKAGMTGVKAKALEGARTTDRTVRENPYSSLIMVFGLGVVVGIFAASMLSCSSDQNDRR